MAQQAVKLYARTWGYTDSSTPVGVIDLSSKTEVEMNMWTGSAPNWTGSELFFTIDEFPPSLSKKRIYYAKAKFAFRSYGQITKYLMMHSSDAFDPATLEYSNKPALRGPSSLKTADISGAYSDTPSDYELNPDTATAETLSRDACALLRLPTHVLLQYKSPSGGYLKTRGYAKLRTLSDNTLLPYIEIIYDDEISITSNIAVETAPTDGYVNPRESTYFSWWFEKSNETDYDCYAEEFGQTSATLYWREVGASSYTPISASGSTQNLTVPANTFPVSTNVEWYLEGTDDGGTTSQTDVYIFSTSAGAATATLKKPINTVEDGSAPIEVSWAMASSDGQTPIAVDLAWKLVGSETWNYLVNHQNVGTSYTAPAGTFSAGEVQLTVRAYNIDDVAGEWSRPSSTTYYSFICVSAPDPVQGLTATTDPMTTVSWQSTGQQGYEITIDGSVVASGFGSNVMSWKSEIPLTDGRHTISVRVQGVYGLWSQPTEISVAIANTVPTEWESITLSGEYGYDAVLTIDNASSVSIDTDVYWYRDGKKIAWTTGETTFTDRFVLGTHNYYAELLAADGNYKRTNTIVGTMDVENTIIADAYNSGWVELRLTDKSENEQSYQYTRTAKLRSMLGAVYPVLELSEFETLSGTFDCSFVNIEEAARLEALKGKVVIVKSKGGQVIIGGLISLQRTIRQFYVRYNFSVQQIDWGDFVRYDARDQF